MWVVIKSEERKGKKVFSLTFEQILCINNICPPSLVVRLYAGPKWDVRTVPQKKASMRGQSGKECGDNRRFNGIFIPSLIP